VPAIAPTKKRPGLALRGEFPLDRVTGGSRESEETGREVAIGLCSTAENASVGSMLGASSLP
jgi:hypothetical protein